MLCFSPVAGIKGSDRYVDIDGHHWGMDTVSVPLPGLKGLIASTTSVAVLAVSRFSPVAGIKGSDRRSRSASIHRPTCVSVPLPGLKGLIDTEILRSDFRSFVSVPLPGLKGLIARHLKPSLNQGCRTTFGKGLWKIDFSLHFYHDGDILKCSNYSVVSVLAI